MAREWNPNTAAWLVSQRGKTNQDEIVAALQQRGHRISRSWLSRIENGAEFSDELLGAFIDLYGSVPPPYAGDNKEPPPGELAGVTAALLSQGAALVAALGAQTGAIGDLVNELRELSLRAPTAGPSVDDLEAQVRALRTEIRLHHPQSDGAAQPEQSAPHGNAR